MRSRKAYDRPNVSRSAARALEMMECFARARAPLRAIQIGTAMGLKASTTAQILKTLVDSGHLIFNAADKTYFPSPRLVPFGLWLGAQYFGDDRIAGMLAELRAGAQECVALLAQHDIYMQIVDVEVLPHHPPNAAVGYRVPRSVRRAARLCWRGSPSPSFER